MQLIDEQGRIFGRLNIIDALVLLFILLLIPASYKAYKLMTKKPVPVVMPAPSTYTIIASCPNCHNDIPIEIEFSRPVSKDIPIVCPFCRNKVIVQPYWLRDEDDRP